MKMTFAKIGWLVCLGGLGVLTVSAMNHRKADVLSGLEVKIAQFDGGQYFLTESDLQKEVEGILGEHELMFVRDIEIENIENELKKNPFIKDVDVYVSSESILSVSVEQREPIARVNTNDGESFYLDAEGVSIPRSKYFTARVPVITGYPDINKNESNKKSELIDLLLTINSDAFYNSLVEQINVDKDQVITIVPKVGDAIIVFGTTEDAEEKLENLREFYSTVYKSNGWDAYASIDVSYSGQLVCKKNKKTNKKPES